jgi:hypothetical protein
VDWARILAYTSGTVGQELLLRNEYLAAEKRILKAQLKTPLRLADAERMALAQLYAVTGCGRYASRAALESSQQPGEHDWICRMTSGSDGPTLTTSTRSSTSSPDPTVAGQEKLLLS